MVLPRFRLGGPAAAAISALSLLLPGAALAATKGVDLRVVNTAGQTLTEHRQYTSTVRIRTDPQANCFGQGTGGSGDRVRVNGATALGAVRDGLAWDRDLRPLSVTDAFLDDGFGLGVCGIGGFQARGSSFWYLKGDHVGSQVSGSQLRVHAGEDVLWYLTPSFPPPPELWLKAPARAQPDVPYQVTVYSYTDDGTRSPAAGARVTGAAAPTGARGHTMVTSTEEGTDTLQATRGQNIPSNRVKVCVHPDLSRCPQVHGKRIVGTVRADEIRGTPGWDAITAAGGDDQVYLRGGGRDRVNCGGGADTVVVRPGDRNDRIAASCERVLRR
jgi:Ca2+-binding RTX toxin-like protein